MKELKIIKDLGFKFSHTDKVDANYYTHNKMDESVDVYLTDKYKIAYWINRNEWSIRQLSTTQTTAINNFKAIIEAYLKWEKIYMDTNKFMEEKSSSLITEDDKMVCISCGEEIDYEEMLSRFGPEKLFKIAMRLIQTAQDDVTQALNESNGI